MEMGVIAGPDPQSMNLVFDFGAVLIEWQPARLVASHFPELAATPEAAQQAARSIFGHADWHAFDRGTLSPESVVQRTAQRLALPLDEMRRLVSGIGERLTPIHETIAVLADLAQRRDQRGDVHLYYLSNMPAPYARTLEQKYAFLAWFDGGIFSGDVQHSKPDVAIYQLLQSRYALEPTQTLFVDDVQENVDVARSLGWGGLRFVSALQLRSSLANWLPQLQGDL
jgi:putative hydrolase of the HAD superfamily